MNKAWEWFKRNSLAVLVVIFAVLQAVTWYGMKDYMRDREAIAAWGYQLDNEIMLYTNQIASLLEIDLSEMNNK